MPEEPGKDELRRAFIRVRYGCPICPYNRYVNEAQRDMMKELGYTGLRPCLRERCQYFKILHNSRGASQHGPVPVFGLYAWPEEVCTAPDSCRRVNSSE